MRRMLSALLVLALAGLSYGDAYHDTYDGASVLQGYLSYATGTITASAALAVGSTLTVTGAATFNGNVTLGNAAGDVITVTGTPTVATEATFNGEVNLGNAAADSVKVTGVVKLITGLMLGDLQLTGDAQLDSTLTVDGLVTINGEAVLGDAATDTTDVTGVLNALDKLAVTGAATFASTVGIAGILTCDSNVVADTLSGVIVATGGDSRANFIIAVGDTITVTNGIVTTLKHAE